jgi:hypothetical protein
MQEYNVVGPRIFPLYPVNPTLLVLVNKRYTGDIYIFTDILYNYDTVTL